MSTSPPGILEKIGNLMTKKVIGPVQVWMLIAVAVTVIVVLSVGASSGWFDSSSPAPAPAPAEDENLLSEPVVVESLDTSIAESTPREGYKGREYYELDNLNNVNLCPAISYDISFNERFQINVTFKTPNDSIVEELISQWSIRLYLTEKTGTNKLIPIHSMRGRAITRENSPNGLYFTKSSTVSVNLTLEDKFVECLDMLKAIEDPNVGLAVAILYKTSGEKVYNALDLENPEFVTDKTTPQVMSELTMTPGGVKEFENLIKTFDPKTDTDEIKIDMSFSLTQGVDNTGVTGQINLTEDDSDFVTITSSVGDHDKRVRMITVTYATDDEGNDKKGVKFIDEGGNNNSLKNKNNVGITDPIFVYDVHPSDSNAAIFKVINAGGADAFLHYISGGTGVNGIFVREGIFENEGVSTSKIVIKNANKSQTIIPKGTAPPATPGLDSDELYTIQSVSNSKYLRRYPKSNNKSAYTNSNNNGGVTASKYYFKESNKFPGSYHMLTTDGKMMKWTSKNEFSEYNYDANDITLLVKLLKAPNTIDTYYIRILGTTGHDSTVLDNYLSSVDNAIEFEKVSFPMTRQQFIIKKV